MSSAIYRMIPDVSKGGGIVTSKSTGARVAIAHATYTDIPLEDASTLNGWTNCGKVGTTAQRPSNAGLNEPFIDTTLSKVIFSNGRGGWHDPFTGGLV
jgi:hypothetical protein